MQTTEWLAAEKSFTQISKLKAQANVYNSLHFSLVIDSNDFFGRNRSEKMVASDGPPQFTSKWIFIGVGFH